MHIGGYFIDNPIALAPMAGITDKPFRRICREFGAGWAVCEMLTSDPSLRHTKKTVHRSDFEGEGGVVAVQIVGSDPQQMAEAARETRPDLKVLLITGYAETTILGSGRLAPGMSVLTKPFAVEVMAARIRSIIEAGRERARKDA